MQTSTVSLQDHLHTLRLLWPASSLVHVGPALSAVHAWYQAWGIPSVHWVEADPKRYQMLLQHAKDGQQVHHALLGAEVLPHTRWHVLSIPNESGLLPADRLSAVWPNLQSAGESIQPQTTLDILLPSPTSSNNWLVIDCLPASYVLQGACKQLAHTSVVVARVLNQQHSELVGKGTSMQELCDFLQPQGFSLLAQEEERHPAYSTVVLVRDYVSLHRQVQQKLERQTQAYQELEARFVDVQKMLQAETHAKAEAQSKLQTELQVATDRQQQMKEEVSKAEAQLELLKELLLPAGASPVVVSAAE